MIFERLRDGSGINVTQGIGVYSGELRVRVGKRVGGLEVATRREGVAIDVGSLVWFTKFIV